MNETNLEKLTGFIMLVGNQGVGKTALTRVLDRVNHGQQPDPEVLKSIRKTNNMEFEYLSTQQVIGDQPYTITVQFLVPPGQKRCEENPQGRCYEEVIEIYRSTIHRLEAVIFTYSLADRDSFQDLGEWLDLVADLLDDTTHFILLGTHLDLIDSVEVLPEEIPAGLESLTQKMRSLRPSWKGNQARLEVSTLTGQNLDKLIYYIAGSIVSARKMLP